MVDLKTIESRTTRVEYVKVLGRAIKEHADLISRYNIDPNIIIEEAFKEVYEQLRRRQQIEKITPTTPQREVVEKKTVGDGVIDEKRPANVVRKNFAREMYDFVKRNPHCESAQIINGTSVNAGSFYYFMDKLIADGLVVKENDTEGRGYRNTFLAVKEWEEDNALAEMFPTGTKTEVFK